MHKCDKWTDTRDGYSKNSSLVSSCSKPLTIQYNTQGHIMALNIVKYKFLCSLGHCSCRLIFKHTMLTAPSDSYECGVASRNFASKAITHPVAFLGNLSLSHSFSPTFSHPMPNPHILFPQQWLACGYP